MAENDRRNSELILYKKVEEIHIHPFSPSFITYIYLYIFIY